MVERIVIQDSAPVAKTVSTLTRSGTTATATTSVVHGYTTGDYITMAGASPTGYTGKVKITVTTTTAFTYTVSSSLATPATGTMTAVYVNDAQGGRKATWTTLDTVWAELMPIRSFERVQMAAVHSGTLYRFRVRRRTDVTPKMRALWTPTWPSGAPQQALEITGVVPDGDGRVGMLIEAAESLR